MFRIVGTHDEALTTGLSVHSKLVIFHNAILSLTVTVLNHPRQPPADAIDKFFHSPYAKLVEGSAAN